MATHEYYVKYEFGAPYLFLIYLLLAIKITLLKYAKDTSFPRGVTSTSNL